VQVGSDSTFSEYHSSLKHNHRRGSLKSREHIESLTMRLVVCRRGRADHAVMNSPPSYAQIGIRLFPHGRCSGSRCPRIRAEYGRMSLASWTPTKPTPPSMASSKDCLPCDDIGSASSLFLSWSNLRVVKKSTAAYFRKSFESKTPPSYWWTVTIRSRALSQVQRLRAPQCLACRPWSSPHRVSNPEDFGEDEDRFLFSVAQQALGHPKARTGHCYRPARTVGG